MAFNKGRESKRRSDQEQRNKSKFDSKSITRIVISLFVAIVAGIGITSEESYLLSDKNVTSVVIAAADIKEGTLIDDTNVNEYFKMKDVNIFLFFVWVSFCLLNTSRCLFILVVFFLLLITKKIWALNGATSLS